MPGPAARAAKEREKAARDRARSAQDRARSAKRGKRKRRRGADAEHDLAASLPKFVQKGVLPWWIRILVALVSLVIVGAVGFLAVESSRSKPAVDVSPSPSVSDSAAPSASVDSSGSADPSGSVDPSESATTTTSGDDSGGPATEAD